MSNAIIAKTKIRLLLSYWLRTIIKNELISMKDIIQTALAFYPEIEVLKFSTTFKDKFLALSDDNKCVTSNDMCHKYIVVDIAPVKHGVHCWRAKIQKNQSTDWLLCGVSEKKAFSKYSYTKVYGIARNRWYPKDQNKFEYFKFHNNISIDHFNRTNLEIDILLNVDKRELKLCVVGLCDKEKEALLWNLDQTKNGYVPHFNLFESPKQCTHSIYTCKFGLVNNKLLI
eukprot:UN02042